MMIEKDPTQVLDLLHAAARGKTNGGIAPSSAVEN
jgi:hypothetical protein